MNMISNFLSVVIVALLFSIHRLKSKRDEEPSQQFKMATQPGMCASCDTGMRNTHTASSGTKVCMLALDISDSYVEQETFDSWYMVDEWFTSLQTLGSEYSYVFYLGYPHLHSFYCNCTLTERLHALYSSLPFPYALLSIYGSENSDVRTLMWNSLARRAFLDDCKYFILSDTHYSFTSSDWIQKGISMLDSSKHCKIGRGIGVVEYPQISIVHKLHLEFFFLNLFSLWGAFNSQFEWLHYLYSSIDCTTELKSNSLSIPDESAAILKRILTLPCPHSLHADVLTSFRELREVLKQAGYGNIPERKSIEAFKEEENPADLKKAMKLCKEQKEKRTHAACREHWDPFPKKKKKKKKKKEE